MDIPGEVRVACRDCSRREPTIAGEKHTSARTETCVEPTHVSPGRPKLRPLACDPIVGGARTAA